MQHATAYKASFFKTLLSSDGHPFRCLQHVIRIESAKSRARAIAAAERRYQRLRHVHDWRLYADAVEVELDGHPARDQGVHARRRS